ncbi:hypothetical protein BT69DRAFT_1282268, partial [Atractiella rhizophila]
MTYNERGVRGPQVEREKGSRSHDWKQRSKEQQNEHFAPGCNLEACSVAQQDREQSRIAHCTNSCAESSFAKDRTQEKEY